MLAALLSALSIGAVLAWLAEVLSRAGAYFLAYPTVDVALAIPFFIGLANKLQGSPYAAKAAPAIKLLRGAVDVLGLFPHEDAYGFLYGALWHLLGKRLPAGLAQVIAEKVLRIVFGWWNIPIAPSMAKGQPEPAGAPPQMARGSVLLEGLLGILGLAAVGFICWAFAIGSGWWAAGGAALALVALAVFCHGPRKLLGLAVLVVQVGSSSAARGQELPPAPPVSSPFGGCSKMGNFCAEPAASITLVGYGFRTHKFSSGFVPGIGYGVIAWANRWYSLGAELRASVQTGAEDRAIFSLPICFAKFVRIGPSFQVINGSGEWGLTFGLGVDAGTIASVVTAAKP